MMNYVKALELRGNYNDEIEHYIQEMPKVELHVHFDGSFSPEILFKHIQKSDCFDILPQNSVLPWDQSLWPVRSLVRECNGWMEYHRLCTCRGKSSLQEMIKCFEIFIPLVQGNIPLLEELAFDFCKRQAEQRVIYTECRYSPHLLAKGGSLSGSDPVDALPVLEAVTRGLRRGSQEFGIVVNQILCCITWRPDWAENTINLASSRKNDYPCAVVGVDIAAGEEHFDKNMHPQLHVPHLEAMRKAQILNLNVTMHAGEIGSGENVKFAIQSYGAKRIGHAYNIVGDLELMNEIKKNRIHIEVCPTSSRETGGWKSLKNLDWKEHPCVVMLQHGISISFNSDDPAVFNTSLSWQYRTVIGKMMLRKEVLLDSVKAAIDAAFCVQEHKLALRKVVQNFETRNHHVINNLSFDDRVIENALIAKESL
jgi:adenosine deaminase